MAVSLKHKFTLLKGDGADTTVVRPSNWNDEHAITLNSSNFVGRLTAGNGPAEEIPFSTQGLALVSATTADPVNDTFGLFETGDVKFSLKTTASPGWIIMNDGTIGSATSGATYANANAWPLYNVLWTNVSNTYAPVTGGRGASAAADFAANKPIALLKVLGRALAAAGNGAGLSARSQGQTAGVESIALAEGHLPPHRHGIALADPGHTHGHNANDANGNLGPGTQSSPRAPSQSGAIINAATTGCYVYATDGGGVNVTSAAGSGVAFGLMQPTVFLLCFIKL